MLYFLRKAFSFNKAKKRPLSPYQFIPNLLKLEDRITPATYTVTNNNDSGTGSLRQAIINANLTLANDSIVFSVTGTITLSVALPSIVTTATGGTLTITGPGSSNLTISGNNGDTNRSFRIFLIQSGGNLSISGVRVSGTRLTVGGGAISNGGTLTVSNSTITGNSVISSSGGGIGNFGTLTVSNSTINNNSAGYGGGGISNFGGTVTISNSLIYNNSISGAYPSHNTNGGGIPPSLEMAIRLQILAAAFIAAANTDL